MHVKVLNVLAVSVFVRVFFRLWLVVVDPFVVHGYKLLDKSLGIFLKNVDLKRE